ncbi:hypothetical protein AWE51_23060 [Aquimarina aggregata]|uniref:Uncharacterized protein n=1 Tax=Aquimarina aggregata TaxID=1642818 RepID=A0A163BDR4_9FLAO|nr:tetratricopeptide repeat protein [Aquimarina aggregata]KZS41287.1 hypothetical protein AWE51_23060 [Aquimarina aggregata]
MINRKTNKKILILLEYLIFLIIPFTVFLFISIRNKNRLNTIDTKGKNTVKQTLSQESTLINKGVALINKKKYQESIQVHLKVIQLNPKNSIAYNNIGIAYGNLKQWDKGIEYCLKAIELNPNFQLAKNNINWMKSEKSKQ